MTTPIRAAIADAFPLDPPIEWFTELPDFFEPNMKATLITEGPEAGRFAATVAQRGTFLLNGGTPWQSVDSPTEYRDAMQGDTVTADGTIIRTANISADLNHVSERASYGQAVDAMANTGVQLARVRYMDIPGFGTIALGAMWPGITDLEVRKMQASALSGDWRWREEYKAYDFAGSICVNNPGLPLPSRPVFQPLAMAASLSFDDHPPVLGSWLDSGQEGKTIIMQGSAPGGGDVHIHVGTPAQQAAASTPATPTTAAPDIVEEVEAEDTDVATARLDAIEARLDGIEAWLAEDAMAQVEAVEAALPEPPAAEAPAGS